MSALLTKEVDIKYITWLSTQDDNINQNYKNIVKGYNVLADAGMIKLSNKFIMYWYDTLLIVGILLFILLHVLYIRVATSHNLFTRLE